MTTIVSKPIVFVSSTISDFLDLRDALKFWLEEMGFQVQMSEYNDFERTPEAGTFEACFESIRESDFYLLLVGRARGSWYDQEARVTVTQQEYRVAYQSFVTTGKPHLLAFVRRDVLTILEERQKAEMPSDAGSGLVDPAFTSGFIQEVKREDEGRLAIAGRGPHPTANWLAAFATFRELTDGLKSSLRIRGPLARNATLENLRHEFARNLRLTMVNFEGKPFYNHLWLGRVRQDVQLKPEHTHADSRIRLTFGQMKDLAAYCVSKTSADALVRSALDEAISSGSLLDYDVEQRHHVSTPLLNALYRLREELSVHARRYVSMNEWQSQVHSLWDYARTTRQPVQIPGLIIALVFGLYDSEQNIVRLLVALLRYLYEHTTTIDVMYRPASPIIGMDERISHEAVSDEQIQEWLERDNPLLRMGSVDLSEEERRTMKQKLDMIQQMIGEGKVDEAMRHLMEAGGEERPPT